MALNSYFDFAENDFQYFKASYDAGIVANMMGAMAQGICEKYMKHLISEYYKPDDAMQQKDFENILRTHSLNRLMKFLKANMGAEFSKKYADTYENDRWFLFFQPDILVTIA